MSRLSRNISEKQFLLCMRTRYRIKKIFQPPISGITAGIIVGIIVGLVVPEMINYLHLQPDYQISVDRSFIQTRNNNSIDISIKNLNYKKYEYPITLAAYNMKYKDSAEYGYITQDIKILPNILDRAIYINKEDCKTNFSINLGKNASGKHLVEVLAMGGDGKERRCHFVLSVG